ncbi:ABC transporter permease [Paraburkholderia oxyphila]|uniref:ABC transporter permease n=1 Tax=Paraburkholderia oxyphila TaxID=614212 RepID=UPI000481C643|nr:ABC transporter permease [Paraburkholderia oxyphila]
MQHSTPLTRSLSIQIRVVKALLMREVLTRYGRHNVGFLWIFFEPMMFTLGVTGLWTILKATHGSTLSITAFAVTGYSSVLVWRNTVGRCALAIVPNQSLLYHRNVRVIDLFIARALLELTGASLSFVFLTLFFMMFGLMEPPHDVAMMIAGWIYLCFWGMGLGLAVGALSERSETADRIWHTVSYLMFPLSGAVFMVQWLPPAFQKVVLFIPMVHGTEMLRGGYFGNAVKPHYNPFYMVVCDLLVWLVALMLVRDASKRVEPE